jgi:HSP20 family protein
MNRHALLREDYMATQTEQRMQRGNAPAQESQGSRRDRRDIVPLPLTFGPFALIRRMQADLDRMLGASSARSALAPQDDTIALDPPIETFMRGNEYVIRVDLPGTSRDDVTVEIGDDAVTVSGERRFERDDERDGVHVTELRYGAFTRVIPLPPGAQVDNATATMRDGVHEIVVPAPSDDSKRSRRVEIQGAQSGQSGESEQGRQGRQSGSEQGAQSKRPQQSSTS